MAPILAFEHDWRRQVVTDMDVVHALLTLVRALREGGGRFSRKKPLISEFS
ncbi:MAG: hypothetical protein HYV96_08525 [Opitutae bacterium]|nr:hypothetical protein [Opitutae bacterium]